MRHNCSGKKTMFDKFEISDDSGFSDVIRYFREKIQKYYEMSPGGVR